MSNPSNGQQRYGDKLGFPGRDNCNRVRTQKDKLELESPKGEKETSK